MTHYLFNTVASMKEYNRSKWWIDSDIIKSIDIFADNITAALKEYQETVINDFYIDISNNAIKNKSPMYIDTKSGVKQIGFVITASCDFDRGDYTGFSKQYFDLWIEISEINDVDFLEV